MTTLALAPSASFAERLRAGAVPLPVQAAAVLAFTALMALGAKVNLYVWEVPFTLQTLAVYGAGLTLGARRGALSAALYLLLGAALPVFAGAEYGAAYLLGATGGYLLALPLVAFVAGYLSRRATTLGGFVLALAAASAVLFACGVLWLHGVAGLYGSWSEALVKGWLRFLPIDVVKIGTAALAYAAARRLG